jgi:hypothetical protein
VRGVQEVRTVPYTAPTGTDGRLPDSERVALLEPPDGDVEVVLDTDAYNEIDDPFALAYANLSDPIDLRAVYAAPFDNRRVDGPAAGMERSYEEIVRLLELLDHPDPDGTAFRGATGYAADAGGPVESPATADLIRRARAREDGGDPLYVLAIGAPTNVASALERAPDIVGNVVVVWLGGQPLDWHTADEFNLRQDPRASRILLDSGVPLVLVPCKNVAEHVRTTVPELEHHLSGGGLLSEYLLETVAEYRRNDDRAAWSKEVWDLAPVAHLLEHEWVPTHLVHSPWLSGDLRYGRDTSRHLVRVAMDARRDQILADLFERLDAR